MKYNILLGSCSPRRKELLETLKLSFQTIQLENIDESYPKEMHKEDVALYLANKKAQSYLGYLEDNQILITADTIVLLENEIFGKPHNLTQAREMLQRLRGKEHYVITGVSLLRSDKQRMFSEKTMVRFKTIADCEIDYYVENFRPLDKAGAYGIQEWIGARAIECIEGSFYNVMGLPTSRLMDELSDF